MIPPGSYALVAALLAAQTPAPAGPPATNSPSPPAADPTPATPPDPAAPAPAVPDPAAAPPPPRPYTPVLLGPPPPPAPEPDTMFPPVPMDQRPPPPPFRGTGLFVGAAIAAGANVGLTAARFALSLGEPSDRREEIRFYLTAIAVPIDVAAGIGLAAGGGYLRGRSDGWRSAYDGRPRLRATAYVQTGAVLLAIGALGYVMAWIPYQGDTSLDSRGGGTLLVESVSSLVMIGASGILAYGYTWRRFAEIHGYSRRLGLRPALAPGFTGLALVGRF